MPVIDIKYDDKIVQDKDIELLCSSIQQIISSITGIEDVPVYAQSYKIKAKTSPIEIFVQISASKVANLDTLLSQIKQKLTVWKGNCSYSHLINLTVIPMDWKFEIGI